MEHALGDPDTAKRVADAIVSVLTQARRTKFGPRLIAAYVRSGSLAGEIPVVNQEKRVALRLLSRVLQKDSRLVLTINTAHVRFVRLTVRLVRVAVVQLFGCVTGS